MPPTVRPIKWPPAPPPVHPKPVLPPEPGTVPVPPSGTIPPEIVVQPPVPPAPVDETPQQYRDGWWSDGWAVLRQSGGSLILSLSDGSIRYIDVRTAGERAADIVNAALGVLGAAARPTQTEPWPPARNAQKNASKESLMGTDLSQDEKLDIFAATLEAVAKDVRDIKTVLVTYQAEPDTAPQDHWEEAFSLAEEPAGLDQPLTTFDAEKVAQYAVFARSVVNGSRTYPDPRRVALAKALALGTAVDAQGDTYIRLCAKWEVDRDVAILALLTGLVDPYDTSFDARLERDVAHLAGTIKPETVNGEVIPRFVRLDFEGCFKKLLPSGSGGQASGNEG